MLILRKYTKFFNNFINSLNNGENVITKNTTNTWSFKVHTKKIHKIVKVKNKEDKYIKMPTVIKEIPKAVFLGAMNKYNGFFYFGWSLCSKKEKEFFFQDGLFIANERLFNQFNDIQSQIYKDENIPVSIQKAYSEFKTNFIESCKKRIKNDKHSNAEG